MELIKQRLFGDWKSSLIALVIFGVLVYLGFSGRVEWGTLQVWFVAVLGFLMSADPKTQEQKDAAAAESITKAILARDTRYNKLVDQYDELQRKSIRTDKA